VEKLDSMEIRGESVVRGTDRLKRKREEKTIRGVKKPQKTNLKNMEVIKKSRAKRGGSIISGKKSWGTSHGTRYPA